MSSFIRVPKLSASLRSAVVAVRIAAVSFLVCMLASVRNSDKAALNRYACYGKYNIYKSFACKGYEIRCNRSSTELTLSRS